ncbi:carbohydrate kinase family protein [Pelosinus baikalensis]|uniref:Carbohydrate kinase n=1 Tax=Pelosinus baikalensis TaxID=2892015 RepID=A0ABS8HQU3_9FIRM|nr:carbohydrate kinase [Pelosinus baikalensis]MCC5464633.1 carbohydrate kinase [Pelosinus baikalensis]
MFHVAALGELLIDFTPVGLSNAKNPIFEQNPGGAPANVLALVSKLGKKTAFLGMVGQDQFGLFLKEVLEKNNINVSGLKISEKFQTTLAFVHLDKSGDRTFSFYRNLGADMMLNASDVNYEVIKEAKIFHFGSVSMTEEPVRAASIKAAMFATENGSIISFDPNYRPLLWSSVEEAKKIIGIGVKLADILKVSEEELELITGKIDVAVGADMLFREGVKVVLVTLGKRGCYYKYTGGEGYVDGYAVNAIDTTGAGDAFLGAFLYQICDMKMDELCGLNKNDFKRIIDFSNAAGALATTRTGAIPALPSIDEIHNIRLTR